MGRGSRVEETEHRHSRRQLPAPNPEPPTNPPRLLVVQEVPGNEAHQQPLFHSPPKPPKRIARLAATEVAWAVRFFVRRANRFGTPAMLGI